MIESRRSHPCKTNGTTSPFRSPQQVSDRLDKLIGEMKHLLDSNGSSHDIVCVAHGHVLSALALRWAEQPLKNGMRLLIETAGLGILW